MESVPGFVLPAQDWELGHCETPPLAASLETLRLEEFGLERQWISLTGLARRTRLTGADTGPVLHVSADRVRIGLSQAYRGGDGGDGGDTNGDIDENGRATVSVHVHAAASVHQCGDEEQTNTAHCLTICMSEANLAVNIIMQDY